MNISYPKVGICIPNYNMGKTIRDAIQSAVDQTYPNLRIYISDNASSDSSWEIIQEFQHDHNNISISRNDLTSSPIDNSNKLYHLAAEEDLLHILCADDILEPDFIQICVDMFQKSKQELGYVNAENYHIIDGEKVDIPIFYKHSGIIKGKEEWLLNIKGFHSNCTATVYNNHVLKKVGFVNEKFNLAVDMHLILKLNSQYDVGYINKPLVGYRLGTGGTTTIESTRITAPLIYNSKLDIINNYRPKDVDIPREKLHSYIRQFCAKYCLNRIIMAIEKKQQQYAKEFILLAASFTPNLVNSQLFNYIMENKSYSIDKIRMYMDIITKRDRNDIPPYNLPEGSTIIHID